MMLSGAMALTAFFALVLLEPGMAMTFVAAAIASGLVGSILVFSTRQMPARESFSEALLFLVLFWLLMPVFIAVPYYFSGAVNSSIVAYFEAVSSLTTTGASTLDADILTKPLHIWRSFCQWIGGVVVATFAVVILAALNLKGTGVHRSVLFTFKKGELFQHLASVVRVVAGIYMTISFLCFCGLIMSGTPVFEAFCLSLTSVSTGGYMPRSGGLESYVGGIGLIALCLTCLLGAFNVAVLWDLFRNRTAHELRRLFTNVEHRALWVVIGLLVVAGIFIGGYYADLRHIFTLIPEAIFFATSTGYDYQVLGADMISPVILISLALIGGSALSTTGGLKLIRVLLLFKHLDTDMDRLTHPSRVVPVMFKKQHLPDSAFLSIWMYFFGYTLVFALGIIAMAASGMEFSMSVATSAASVANMGPLLDMTLPAYGYAEFTNLQLIISTALMLIGRIEVLAAFAVLSPGLWRK